MMEKLHMKSLITSILTPECEETSLPVHLFNSTTVEPVQQRFWEIAILRLATESFSRWTEWWIGVLIAFAWCVCFRDGHGYEVYSIYALLFPRNHIPFP